MQKFSACICIVCLLLSTRLFAQGISSDELDGEFQTAARRRLQCGPISVWYALNILGRDVSLATISSEIHVTERGASVNELLSALRRYELPAKLLLYDPTEMNTLPAPSIMVLQDHCVVYLGTDRTRATATIFEPTTREQLQIPIADLKRSWRGHVIKVTEDVLSWRYYLIVTATALALAAPCIVYLLRSEALAGKRRPGTMAVPPSDPRAK